MIEPLAVGKAFSKVYQIGKQLNCEEVIVMIQLRDIMQTLGKGTKGGEVVFKIAKMTRLATCGKLTTEESKVFSK